MNPSPMGGCRLAPGHTFKHALNWLSGFMFMQGIVFTNRDQRRPRRSGEMMRCYMTERATPDFLARAGGKLKVTKPKRLSSSSDLGNKDIRYRM